MLLTGWQLSQLPIPKLTQRKLANELLETILAAGKNAKRIDNVCNICTKNSIQETEINRRSKGSLQLQQVDPTSVIKQLGALLSSNENKNKFISFFVDEWEEQHDQIESKTFYVNSRKEAFRIISEDAKREVALDGDHQEANTRIFTHALRASSANDNIVICSPDGDVFMIAIAKFEDIPADLYMLTGTKVSRRIIDIKQVADAFFDSYCELIPQINRNSLNLYQAVIVLPVAIPLVSFVANVRSKHCLFFAKANLLFKRFTILGRLMNCQRKPSRPLFVIFMGRVPLQKIKLISISCNTQFIA